jgi:hypothetical protein
LVSATFAAGTLARVSPKVAFASTSTTAATCRPDAPRSK